MNAYRIVFDSPAAAELDPSDSVNVFLFEDGGWRQFAILSLDAAGDCISRGTGRIVAAEPFTGRPLLASHEADLNL